MDLPTLTDKDIDDIVNWGIKYDVDFVAASFVRKASDVDYIREVLEKNGGAGIQIISKIENQEGLANYAEILNSSDGIMVARGDLGMEIVRQRGIRLVSMVYMDESIPLTSQLMFLVLV